MSKTKLTLDELIALARARGDWTLPVLLHWRKLRAARGEHK